MTVSTSTTYTYHSYELLTTHYSLRGSGEREARGKREHGKLCKKARRLLLTFELRSTSTTRRPTKLLYSRASVQGVTVGMCCEPRHAHGRPIMRNISESRTRTAPEGTTLKKRKGARAYAVADRLEFAVADRLKSRPRPIG